MSLTVTHATTTGNAKISISYGVVGALDVSKTFEAVTNPVLGKQGVIQRTAAELFLTGGSITSTANQTLNRPMATR